MPHVVVRRVLEFVGAREGAEIAILGASYKANVDDTRESPTERVEELLRERPHVALGDRVEHARAVAALAQELLHPFRRRLARIVNVRLI
ncbi:MAG: hypothetical protein NVS1B2_27850 [Vulcanimicrobiaceae bacterium]